MVDVLRKHLGHQPNTMEAADFHPQQEIFAHRKAGIEPARRIHQCPARHASMDRPTRAREQLFALVGLLVVGGHEGLPAGALDPQVLPAAIRKANFGIRVEGIQHALEKFRRPRIVGIEKRHEPAACQRKAGITCSTYPLFDCACTRMRGSDCPRNQASVSSRDPSSTAINSSRRLSVTARCRHWSQGVPPRCSTA